MRAGDYNIPPHHVEYDQFVSIDELNIDASYQRDTNALRAKKIGKNYLTDSARAIIVSVREDGSLWIVDGGHRAEGARRAGHEKIRADLHHELSVAQEAELYTLHNEEAKRQSPLERYKAGVVAGRPDYVALKSILDDFRLTAGKDKGPYTVSHVSAMMALINMYGPDIVRAAFRIARDAWDYETCTWDSGLIGGLSCLIYRNGKELDDLSELTDRLSQKGTSSRWAGMVTSLVADKKSYSGQSGGAGQGGGVRYHAYDLMVGVWNKGRQKRNPRYIHVKKDDLS